MPHSSSSPPRRRAYARTAASTASMCLRSESDSVHSHTSCQASSREGIVRSLGEVHACATQRRGRPNVATDTGAEMIGILVAVVVAAVVFWLLGYIVPTFIAALIALIVFLALAFGGFGPRLGGGG